MAYILFGILCVIAMQLWRIGDEMEASNEDHIDYDIPEPWE